MGFEIQNVIDVRKDWIGYYGLSATFQPFNDEDVRKRPLLITYDVIDLFTRPVSKCFFFIMVQNLKYAFSLIEAKCTLFI